MNKNIKNIAILTSGGDSPGMNNAIRAVARRALSLGQIPYVIINGFKGMYDGDIRIANIEKLDVMKKYGGTCIYASRFPDFEKKEIRKIAINNLKAYNIDALVVIGGNGSYKGAAKLQEEGVNVICLPGTIDNDIASTEYTIGFDTSLSTIVDAVEKIRDTSYSHGHIYLVEIMGRKCPDLTIFAGYAAGADYVVTTQNVLNKDDFVKIVKELRASKHRSIIILVNEKMYGFNGLPSLDEIKQHIIKQTNNIVKVAVLGFIQRGGEPTATERFNATRMGAHAVDLISCNKFGRAVGIKGLNLVDYDLKESIKFKNPDRTKMLKTINEINKISKKK